MNPALEKLTGYTSAELLGARAPHPWWTADEQSGSIDEIGENISQGVNGLEKLFRKKNGERFWVEITAVPVTRNGELQYALVTWVDITERRQAEEELRESEERFRSIAESADFAIISADKHGNILLWNKTAETFFDYSADEVVGLPLTLIMPERFREAYKNGINRAVSKGALNAVGKRHMLVGLRRDGSEFPIEISLAAWKRRGEIFFTGIISDITERKLMEEELRKYSEHLEEKVEERTAELNDIVKQLQVEITERKQAEEKMRVYLAGIDNANDGIAFTKMNGDMLYFNKSACRIFGFTSAEMREINISKFSATSADKGNLEGSLREKGEFFGEIMGERKNGEIFPATLSVSIINDDKGDPVGRMGVFSDITERKQLEEERQKAAKLESVGTLAGGIAHDFNNLLTGIMGNIGLAMRAVGTGEKDSASQRLEEAEKASIRARDLTQQLLTFSRGGAPLKKIVSIAGLLKESVGFSLRGSSIRCDFDLPADLWSVDIDEGQINQVIANLTINADQAMPDGGIINVGARNTVIKREGALPLSKGKYVEITIEDHGIGISKEHLGKIFDPYFTTKQKGSGL